MMSVLPGCKRATTTPEVSSTPERQSISEPRQTAEANLQPGLKDLHAKYRDELAGNTASSAAAAALAIITDPEPAHRVLGADRLVALDTHLAKLNEAERTALLHRLENTVLIRRALDQAARADRARVIAAMDDGAVLAQAALRGLREAGFYAADRNTAEIVAAITPEQFDAALGAVAYTLTTVPEDAYQGIMRKLGLVIELPWPR